MKFALKSYHIESLKIINKNEINPLQTIKLHINTKVHSVSDAESVVNCSLILNLDDEDKQSKKSLLVEMDMSGVFESENMTTEEIRNQAVIELLPFMRAHIASGMSVIGMDPILIPPQLINDFIEKKAVQDT